MLKVKLLKTLANPRGVFHEGQTYTCDVDEAKQLVAARAAVYEGDPPPENLESEPEENAASKKKIEKR